MTETEIKAKWDDIKAELIDALAPLKGSSIEKATAYLENIETKTLQIAAMTPVEARQAMDDLAVNARADLYILGVEAETAVARVVIYAIKTGTKLLRAAIGVPV